MDSKQYCSILEQSLLGTLQDYSLPRDSIIFQHDNDRKHTARRTKEWLHNHNITVLPWPLSSPDMNIIEHVWGRMVKRHQTLVVGLRTPEVARSSPPCPRP